MFAYCNNCPIISADARGKTSEYVTVSEDHETFYGRFFKINVSASVKIEVSNTNDGIPCTISIGEREIEVAYEVKHAQYSFGVDDHKILVGVGCVFGNESFSLKGSVFSDELICSFEREIEDGLILEVAITATSDNKSMFNQALKHASPLLAALGAGGMGMALGGCRAGGRPFYALTR